MLFEPVADHTDGTLHVARDSFVALVALDDPTMAHLPKLDTAHLAEPEPYAGYSRQASQCIAHAMCCPLTWPRWRSMRSSEPPGLHRASSLAAVRTSVAPLQYPMRASTCTRSKREGRSGSKAQAGGAVHLCMRMRHVHMLMLPAPRSPHEPPQKSSYGMGAPAPLHGRPQAPTAPARWRMCPNRSRPRRCRSADGLPARRG